MGHIIQDLIELKDLLSDIEVIFLELTKGTVIAESTIKKLM